MFKIFTFFILSFSIVNALSAQVPMGDITEDKNQMADDYYGTFKYGGKPFSGQGIALYPDGSVKSIRSFKEGKYHGLWTEWYSNGHRKFQGNRVDNKEEGLGRWWYENGQLKKQGTYDQDKQEGIAVLWHTNGHLKQVRHYQQDKVFGPWTRFDNSGRVLDEGDEKNLFYQPLFGDSTLIKGIERTSPSFTADGKAMVFAMYNNWVKKVPYIAYFREGHWAAEKLVFRDTLYNLAISPSGDRIIFQEKIESEGEESTRVYTVDSKDGNWEVPVEIEELANRDAGYFQILQDGNLYFFARKPRTGIYMAKPDKEGGYLPSTWLSDMVSLPGSDSFDIHVNNSEDKLIISQYYSLKKYPERGPVGLYYYEKKDGKWIREKRLPLGYGWGPCVTPRNKFVFVRKGDIQFIPLEELGISW